MTFNFEALYNVEYLYGSGYVNKGKMVLTCRGRPLDLEVDMDNIRRGIQIKERLGQDVPVSVIGEPKLIGYRRDGILWEPPIETEPPIVTD